MNSEKYTNCYNCTGANIHLLCGFPQPGCLLCRTYGDGVGKLLVAYRHISVEITTENYGVTQTHKFSPPSYECLTCKDTKKFKYRIWDDALVDNGCSDHGEHNMPKFAVACHKCLPEQHETEFETAKKNYFKNKAQK